VPTRIRSPLVLFSAKERIRIPQADEIPRVMDLLKLVGQGVKNAISIAEKLGIEPRQSSYYREAAEILGFLDDRVPYGLTDLSSEFLDSDKSRKTRLMTCALLCNPIIRRVVSCLQTGVVHSLSKKEIEDMIVSISDVRGATVQRRAQSIIAWLRWLQSNYSVLSVEGDTIRIETQRRLL